MIGRAPGRNFGGIRNLETMKYVLVTGGVVSGLGKGVTASSIGVLLKACGHRVTSIKIGATCRVPPGGGAPLDGRRLPGKALVRKSSEL